MKPTKIKHKQSKFFTVMLIPDSSAKVRRVSIPYWVLSLLIIPLMTVAIVFALFQTRVFALETLLDYSEVALRETIGEKDRLVDSLQQSDYALTYEEEYVVSDASQEKPQERRQADNNSVAADRSAQGAQQSFLSSDITEQQMEEILIRLSAIDETKHSIVSVFRDIAALDTVPFLFDESTLSGGVARAQGGPDIEATEILAAEIEQVISNTVTQMNVLNDYAKDLEAYFQARPIGFPAVTRRISSGFGHRPNPFTGRGMEMHNGVDFGMPVGTEIFATAYGKVTYAGWHAGGFGLVVMIEHGFGYSTIFAHNSEVLVSPGEHVERGQVIALSGNTGRSTAPHLHYEVRTDGIPVDPRGFLG